MNPIPWEDRVGRLTDAQRDAAAALMHLHRRLVPFALMRVRKMLPPYLRDEAREMLLSLMLRTACMWNPDRPGKGGRPAKFATYYLRSARLMFGRWTREKLSGDRFHAFRTNRVFRDERGVRDKDEFVRTLLFTDLGDDFTRGEHVVFGVSDPPAPLDLADARPGSWFEYVQQAVRNPKHPWHRHYQALWWWAAEDGTLKTIGVSLKVTRTRAGQLVDRARTMARRRYDAEMTDAPPPADDSSLT